MMDELPSIATGLINPFQIIDSVSMKNVVPNMATFPTPPSSSGDSPQPIYFVASPGSNNFSVASPESSHSYPHAHILSADGNMISIPEMDDKDAPYLRFIEQPTNKFRFRYKSEMAGTHGSLCGMNSDKSRKQTYPTVELVNCPEKAEIRCSIYQHNIEEDFKPHPHRLIMKRGKEEMDDPHDIKVGPEEGFVATFHSMGIIHTARKNIVGELVRKKSQLKKELVARLGGVIRDLTSKEYLEENNKIGRDNNIYTWVYCKQLSDHDIDLRIFQFILHTLIISRGYEKVALKKIIMKIPENFNHMDSASSRVPVDMDTDTEMSDAVCSPDCEECALTGDLKIVRMDHCASKAKGGQEIFLLVERVTKKNIKIRFFELDDDEQEVWEGYGKFSELDVHHQYAIVFRTPAFRDQDITHPVLVYMELVRPSDSARSEMREFRYTPNGYKTGAKRPRSSLDSSSSYDSKSVNSNELPATIATAMQPQNLYALPNANSWNQPPLNDDQLNVAMNDFDSDEFNLLFECVANDLPSSDMIIAKDSPLAQQFNSMHIDAMKPTNGQRNMPSVLSLQKDTNYAIVKMEISSEDVLKAQRTYNELKSFARSKDAQTRAPLMLDHHLGVDKDQKRFNNALHVFIALNRKDEVSLILKMLLLSNKEQLVNVVNGDNLTPLHIAVMCRNEDFVGYLARCNADTSIQNSQGRTPLHEAVKSGATLRMFELLLSFKNANTMIDVEDYDGSTALKLAIETGNMAAIKLLCKAGADVNKQHRKDGHTPLRMAVEYEFADAVHYFLEHPDFDFKAQNDFQNVSAFQAAVLKPSSLEIMEPMVKFAAENKIPLELKKEIEDEEEVEEMEQDIDIKPDLQKMPEDITKLYAGLKTLTPKCLNEIASYLDKGDKYKHLAELLDIGHLLQNAIFKNGESISKNLLQYAFEKENDILVLRDFLHMLDEPLAVAAMDQMAMELQQL